MDGTDASTNYSADVDIWLDCLSYGKVRLSQVSSSFIIVDAAVVKEIPAGTAKIILTIDGKRSERVVHLVKGLSRNSRYALVEASELPPF